MVIPDLRSLILCLAVVSVTLAFCMFYFLKERKTYPGFLNWAMGVLLFSIGIFFVGLRDVLSDFFSIVLANVLSLGSLIILYSGFKIFVHKKITRYAHLSVLIIFTFCISFFTYIIPSLLIRIILISIMMTIYFLLIIKILSKDVKA